MDTVSCSLVTLAVRKLQIGCRKSQPGFPRYVSLLDVVPASPVFTAVCVYGEPLGVMPSARVCCAQPLALPVEQESVGLFPVLCSGRS